MLRPKKRKSHKVIRVDSVEIYKQGSNEELFNGIISDFEKEQNFVTFYDLEIEKDHEYFANDVLVHNCHKISSFSGRHYAVLQGSFCPARFGVTATLPTNDEARFVLECAVGPVIHTFSVNDGIAAGILSKPKIMFTPYIGADFIGSVGSYADTYKFCIVNNLSRNKAVVEITKNLLKKNESCLIFVRQIEHGNKISTLLKKSGIKHCWVNGKSEKEERMSVKEALESKEAMVAICSTIWNEGISIKSLNNCIVAGGGKDEKMVLQVVGRGTRVDDGKTTVTVWDFLDPQKYLAEHCIQRMRVYNQQGWEISISNGGI